MSTETTTRLPKSTMTYRTEPARAGSVQRIVRRFYYIEGETGVGWGPKPYGIYTAVGPVVNSLKEAKRLLAAWHKSRCGLFWSRIVRLDETKTVMATKPPNH